MIDINSLLIESSFDTEPVEEEVVTEWKVYSGGYNISEHETAYLGLTINKDSIKESGTDFADFVMESLFTKNASKTSTIVKKMRQISNLNAMTGCSDKQIEEAEHQLNLKFPKEYIDYVKEFGCIDFGSTEWTGLNVNGRLNTVTATKKEQSVNKSFPKGYFVLEDLAIDAKKVIVNTSGEVYYLQYNKLQLAAKSISKYLDICIKNNKK